MIRRSGMTHLIDFALTADNNDRTSARSDLNIPVERCVEKSTLPSGRVRKRLATMATFNPQD